MVHVFETSDCSKKSPWSHAKHQCISSVFSSLHPLKSSIKNRSLFCFSSENSNCIRCSKKDRKDGPPVACECQENVALAEERARVKGKLMPVTLFHIAKHETQQTPSSQHAPAHHVVLLDDLTTHRDCGLRAQGTKVCFSAFLGFNWPHGRHPNGHPSKRAAGTGSLRARIDDWTGAGATPL